MVFTPKLLSTKRTPTTIKAILMREAKVDGLTAGTTALRITARPVTPPVLKWLGNLKKYTPAATRKVPKVSRGSWRRVCLTRCMAEAFFRNVF